MVSKYAFVIIHFGDKINYLELEIYLLLNLTKHTKNDIIYLYSINDTPESFIQIISKFCKVISYDDNNITFNIKNFKSSYTIFNTLRTCNFLFAYKLIEYKKICIIESDMLILKNIDSIFELNIPAALSYHDESLIMNNYQVDIDKEVTLNNCNKISKINGGIMIFKPSLKIYELLIKNIKFVIKNNCMYPNETLFLLSYDKIFNLPLKYNATKYQLIIFKKNFKLKNDYFSIIHFNTQYKHIHIIKDNYLDDLKNKNFLLYKLVLEFKKKYFDKYSSHVNKLLNKVK